MFCIFTLMLGILCFSNLDYRIADFNINGYINGDINELDMYNIKYNLSDTAILAAVKYTDNDKVSEQMHNYLDNISLDYYDDGISYFNFESYAAKKALEEYRETVNEKS